MAPSDLKPITVYWRPQVPNPTKVVIILEELGVPYKGEFIEHADLKQPAFESVNPNGRVPAIHDPNTNITLWESGAIVTYLIDQYDTEKKLTYDTFPEKYHLVQWQHFQASGHGPYLGQAAWFLMFHPEQIDSAKERYIKETQRVVKVLDKWLEGKDSLVGDKLTYADLSFVAWNAAIGYFMSGRPKDEWEPETQFPNFFRWQNSMLARPSVQKASTLAKVEDVHL
ncbi:glutathione S-transferase [Melanomma pulvis-pyrius CBS 109.77]|uniref:Glutathione S-transferase n=1 Tax=Melanomma pulvis-pyrius CBS 109.77 TaxID=1314802 RepID=A0A6A6X976_9PLEO|nr:glutathione S-transferase [Melanomma pulvis-pyrius CBS 109.77]